MRRLASGILAYLLICCPAAFGWGGAGHRIVAMIAEQRLSPEARAQVTHLLLDGQFTMSQVSTCPDSLRSAERVPLKPEEQYCLQIAKVTNGSAPWHFIDIPLKDPARTLASYCPESNCVTAKIAAFREVLHNSSNDAERREALMYLIHFVGDVHQPLHCSERQCDQGGNLEHVDVYLKSGERPDHRLHGAWDTDLVDKAMEDAHITDEHADAMALAAQIKPAQAERWKSTPIDDVAWEGWKLAKDHAYQGIPNLNYCDPEVKNAPAVPTDLSGGYEKGAERVIREQLMKAGVRLANLLELSLRQDKVSASR